MNTLHETYPTFICAQLCSLLFSCSKDKTDEPAQTQPSFKIENTLDCYVAFPGTGKAKAYRRFICLNPTVNPGQSLSAVFEDQGDRVTLSVNLVPNYGYYAAQLSYYSKSSNTNYTFKQKYGVKIDLMDPHVIEGHFDSYTSELKGTTRCYLTNGIFQLHY